MTIQVYNRSGSFCPVLNTVPVGGRATYFLGNVQGSLSTDSIGYSDIRGFASRASLEMSSITDVVLPQKYVNKNGHLEISNYVTFRTTIKLFMDSEVVMTIGQPTLVQRHYNKIDWWESFDTKFIENYYVSAIPRLLITVFAGARHLCWNAKRFVGFAAELKEPENLRYKIPVVNY